MAVEIQPMFKRVLDCFEQQSALAEALGVDRQVVNHWVLKMGYIPSAWVLPACNATGGKVVVSALLQETHRMEMQRKIERQRKRWEQRQAREASDGR